ncbi:unnamed protein product [Phaeothamnion confervicola]
MRGGSGSGGNNKFDSRNGGREPLPFFGPGGSVGYREDDSMRALWAWVVVILSAVTLMLVAAGAAAAAFVWLQEAGVIDEDAGAETVWDACGDGWDGTGSSTSDTFIRVQQEQFGYVCAPTALFAGAWLAYWAAAFLFVSFKLRLLCFACLPGGGLSSGGRAAAAAGPQRRPNSLPLGTVYPYASHAGSVSSRSLDGPPPDPSKIRYHWSSPWIRLLALVNVGAGAVYMWWRVQRSMVDLAYPAWSWIFFAGECILMLGVFFSHASRMYPSERDHCTMDELVTIDNMLGAKATVAILVPTAGEKLRALKQVIVGAYSQRLWASTEQMSRQLRVCVLDEKARPEVLELVQIVYELAGALAEPAVQREISIKLEESWVSLKIWLDTFETFDRLDRYIFSRQCSRVFELSAALEEVVERAHGAHFAPRKVEAPPPKVEPGMRRVFDGNKRIPSLAYYARKDAGMPRVSPKAGNMNAAIFPTEPGMAPVIGGARIVMVNDARHRIKSECLQRTMPYFFRLRWSRPHYEWADVAYVQLPQRFADLKDGDPLGNFAVMTFYIANVAKDGAGAVTSCGQGSLWRVDALSGYDVRGKLTIPDPVQRRELIGHECGFRAEVLIEDTHTSLSLFRYGWRSAYVCEPNEALAICVDPPDTVEWRVKQVFRWHLGAVQLFLNDGLRYTWAWGMPSLLHRVVAFDSITYYFQALGGMLIVLMPIIFCITQTTPFDTRGLQFIYFFFPYIITATLPTTLSVSWKGVHPDRVLTDEQFWLATCYVQLWALFTGLKDKLMRADPDNAWTKKCPTWPLPLTYLALAASAVYTTVAWALRGFSEPLIWFTSLGACVIIMHGLWPMFYCWLPKGAVPGMPTAYTRKILLVLAFIAGSGLLVAFAVN